MKVISILGPRFRDVGNEELFAKIMASLAKRDVGSVVLLSTSCDVSFGKALKEYCGSKEIRLVEYLVYYHCDWNDEELRELKKQTFRSRQVCMVSDSDEIHIAMSSHAECTYKSLLLVTDFSSFSSMDYVTEFLMNALRSSKDLFLYRTDNSVAFTRLGGVDKIWGEEVS